MTFDLSDLRRKRKHAHIGRRPIRPADWFNSKPEFGPVANAVVPPPIRQMEDVGSGFRAARVAVRESA